ncbi:hypothetical protein WH50_07165 [Pokkaliibacter plantistimulans]|uniref:HAD family hydrolase n=1 Tax=Pokkaliibacter plantistimulans TaxID=1635171 RepID=A0ABX5LZ71_9GAMM|nr:HAD family hydrolase [Pokkaliibacter plantistimulans]PXF31976.1 hypothetical protein WH50_07165 [Pokkaliibacter plantistimulans]
MVKKNTIALHSLGKSFVGPILVSYVTAIARKTSDYPFKLFALAREGYYLQQALKAVNIDSTYLLASRTFLFRICIHLPDSWQWSLAGQYEGTVGSFLQDRFGFTQQTLSLIFDETLLEDRFDLSSSSDLQAMEAFLEDNLELLREQTGPSREAYLAYLQHVGFMDSLYTPLLLDLGYSGTIQKLLTLLTAQHTEGFYVIATKPGTSLVAGKEVTMQGCLKEGVKLGDGYLMLDRSMFVECLLTSPNGQFVDIDQLGGTEEMPFTFYYGRETNAQRYFSDLELVMQGALSHVAHCYNHGIVYTAEEVEQLFKPFVTQRNMLPKNSWHLFLADDSISGNDFINPMQFFCL